MQKPVVGILTFHHVDNYGAVVQCFALQTTLELAGYAVRVVNVAPFTRDSGLFSGLRWSIRSKGGAWLNKASMTKKISRFRQFRETKLNLTLPYDSLNEFELHESIPDVYVVGSDQVWNPKFGPRSMSHFTLTDYAGCVPRVAYAACIGFPQIQNRALAPYRIDRFDKLLVRNSFTAERISTVFGRPSEVVVDPTLLDGWLNSVSLAETNARVPDKYLLVYGYKEHTMSLALKLSAEYDLPIVGIGMEGEPIPSHVDVAYSDAGPMEWLSLFSKAGGVVTQSFHGMLVAAKFGRKFIVAIEGLSHRSAARIVDSAFRLNLSDKLQVPGEGIDSAISAFEAKVSHAALLDTSEISKMLLVESVDGVVKA